MAFAVEGSEHGKSRPPEGEAEMMSSD